MQELPVADTSLSEDVVIVLAIDSDATITMFILHWRRGTMVSVKTDVSPVSIIRLRLPSLPFRFTCNIQPEHPYFAILSLNDLSIWIDSPSAPRTYSFPLSTIFPHLSYPPQPPIFLPQPTPTVLTHISNTTPSAPANYTPLYRDTTRKWPMGPNSALLSRPLSILHVACRFDEDTERIFTSLSHEYLPTDFTSRPTERAYFAPMSILTTPISDPTGEVINFPVIAAESANVILPELLPSGEAELRVITLPPDVPAERHRHPQWYNDNLMRPLEAPPELDLAGVVIMSLDDATGVLAVAVQGGDIFILEY